MALVPSRDPCLKPALPFPPVDGGGHLLLGCQISACCPSSTLPCLVPAECPEDEWLEDKALCSPAHGAAHGPWQSLLPGGATAPLILQTDGNEVSRTGTAERKDTVGTPLKNITCFIILSPEGWFIQKPRKTQSE